MSKRTWFVTIGAVLALGLLVPAAGVADPGSGKTPIKVGPISVVAQDDIGTCNNVWAIDQFQQALHDYAQHGRHVQRTSELQGRNVHHAGWAQPGSMRKRY